jgi:group I intron endonuclease
MTCGSIYKIVFPNGKHYIGLTTISLEQRTKEHKKYAKNGDAKILYKAIRKYGMVDTFELIEIDIADTIEELCEKEIKYITEYDSYYVNENGYNMTYGGEGTNGYVFTEEDKQKMSDSQKKFHEKNPDAGKEHGKRITQYFEDNPDAKEQISEGLKQYYKNNPDAKEQISERMKKRLNDNPEERRKSSDGRGKNKPFDVFTIDGTFIETFIYQFEAREYLQKKYGINSNILISNVLKGRRKSSKGFVFKYK